jgi:stearoyl-CoA desaturase (Delta-9 desaturase)
MSLAPGIDTPSSTSRATSNARLTPDLTARRVERWVTIATVIVPFAGMATAIALFWRNGVDVVDLVLLGIMYALTTLGVGVGFHRLITHGAFKTGPVVKTVLVVLGSMAAQGPVFFWAAIHRRHHAHSDRPGDPHSPHVHGSGAWQTLRGLWYAHTGWLFDTEFADFGLYVKYVPDLLRDRLLYRLHRLYAIWIVLGLALPAAAAGVATSSWSGAFHGLVWGGFARIFLLHHASWSINSICHMFGSQTYRVADRSVNNLWLAIPSFGESWHNNHHAFPSSAMHGLRWWQVDLNGYAIRFLQALGLAWDVRGGPRGAGRQVVNAGESNAH